MLFLNVAKDFLKRNFEVEKRNLIIESWLPQNSLEIGLNIYHSKDYNKMYIVGLQEKYDTATIQERQQNVKFNRIPTLFSNGAVYFTKKALDNLKNYQNTYSQIIIYAQGDSSYHNKAFFTVAFYDSIIGFDRVKTRICDTYVYNGRFASDKFRGFNIYFGNNMQMRNTIRSLQIDSIKVDALVFKYKSDFTVIYDKELKFGYANYPFISRSEYLNIYLGQYFFKDKNAIVSIDTLYTGRNKTRAMAKKFASYIKEAHFEADTFNILTYDMHTRRSLITYRLMLPDTRIGTISIKNRKPIYLSIFSDTYIIFNESASILLNYFYSYID